MNPSKETILAKFKEFVQGLKKTDRIALLFDSDPDGMCSAVTASRAIEKMTGMRPVMRMPGMYGMDFFGDRMRQEFQKNQINKLIVFDLTLEGNPIVIQNLPLLERQLDAIVFFDHHPLGVDISSHKTLMVKSQFISDMNPAKYCTSKLVFDMFSPFANLSDCDWIASVGIIADTGYLEWKDFVDQASNQNQLGIVREQNPFESDLGKLSSLILDTFIVEPKNALKLFEEIHSAKKPSELFDSQFMEYVSLVEAEVNYWVKEFESKAERFPQKNLILFEIHPKFKMKSLIATRISFQQPADQTVVVAQNLHSGIVSFSARRQDGLKDLNQWIQSVIHGIPNSSGGGHKQASAGMIPESEWPKVKRRLIDLA